MANWHCFKALKRFFLFDVLSNSLFVIEEPVYDYLQGKSVTTADLLQIEADLTELRAQGLLSNEPEIKPEVARQPWLKALCLHVAHDCNLRCKYCFAGTGPFNGSREMMSFEVGKHAIDLLLKQSGSRRQLEIDFFGGEPLMNLDVVKQIVAYGRTAASGCNKDIHFTLTTNGVLLDRTARDFLNEQGIALVLSLDGRPEVNDRMRGTGCYQKVAPNFLALIQERGFSNYYLRGTYTAHNLDFTKDVGTSLSIRFPGVIFGTRSGLRW